jgi:hypothetical protein
MHSDGIPLKGSDIGAWQYWLFAYRFRIAQGAYLEVSSIRGMRHLKRNNQDSAAFVQHPYTIAQLDRSLSLTPPWEEMA